MFLKKVDISGFKSFANKTTLEFLPAHNFSRDQKNTGITAIVGPNGSGKSNVADAIRWAMGEQSMKNLRGKKSEDIIFAGSGKKARLSSASVNLHFDNSDKRIPLEFSEVSIMRKIFRSGESEYLINGSKVRLIDVVDLLAKAGIGKESYCVINQGMSDAVLNATPVERRSILEDAAGVKQFQIKKERALRKMDSTQDNLLRVKDLMNEIEPHLRMLKRQAEKARKGKDVAGELKEKQEKLFAFLWHMFQQEKVGFSEEKNNLGIRMMNVQREVDKFNDEISKESRETKSNEVLVQIEAEREVLRRELNATERELAITEGRLEIEREKLSQHKLIQRIPVDLGYVREKLQIIRDSQESLVKRIENVETLEELQDVKEYARAIAQQVHELHQDAGKGEIVVEQVKSPEEEENKKRIAVLEKSLHDIRIKIDSLNTELSKKNQRIAEEVENEKAMRQKFFEFERNLHTKQDELNRLKDQFNESKIKLAKIDVREEDLITRIRSELHKEVTEVVFDGQECDSEALEREVNRLKVQLEQIGGIDPLVMDEYEETNARFDFLTNESNDLLKAIESLREVIKEMDDKIDKVFAEAYEKINDEFTKYFRIIFGGGNAHLIKSRAKSRKPKVEGVEGSGEETEDTTEAESAEAAPEKDEIGIDIFACPPGKKIANLSMLSGGERSLTSLALLFSIISFNPPPFAVLDEVEAALDEANSRRFSRILQELSSNTQFIAISHNRETMRQASLLYGVTMTEDGISKLLSIRLDQVGQGGNIKA